MSDTYTTELDKAGKYKGKRRKRTFWHKVRHHVRKFLNNYQKLNNADYLSRTRNSFPELPF